MKHIITGAVGAIVLLGFNAPLSAQDKEDNQLPGASRQAPDLNKGAPPKGEDRPAATKGEEKDQPDGEAAQSPKGAEERQQAEPKGKPRDKADRAQADEGPGAAQKARPEPDAKAAQKDLEQKRQQAEPKAKAGDKADQAQTDQDRGAKARDRAESAKDRAIRDQQSARDRASDRQRQDERAQSTQRGERRDGRQIPGRDQDRATAQDRDRAGSTTADRERSQQDLDRSGRSGRRVTLDDDRRTRVRELLRQERTQRVTNFNVSVDVGTRLPRNVRLRPLSPRILRIAPEYRDYRYVVFEDRIAIVDPRTYEVVDIIDEDDTGPARSRDRFVSGDDRGGALQLTSEQRRLVARAIPPDCGEANVRARLALGAQIPDSVRLMRFPELVVEEVPELGRYRYVVSEGEIVVVDPDTRNVVGTIERA